MRRLFLLLALTALLVASAFASGSALAQEQCLGLTIAIEAQANTQGDESSALDPGVFQQLHCVPIPH